MARELNLRAGQINPRLDRRGHAYVKREADNAQDGPHVLVHRRTRLTFRAGPTAGEARPHGVDSNEGGGAEGRGTTREVGGGAGFARGAGNVGGSINLSLAKACGGLALSMCELHRTASSAGEVTFPRCSAKRHLRQGHDAPRTATAPVCGVGEMRGAVSGQRQETRHCLMQGVALCAWFGL